MLISVETEEVWTFSDMDAYTNRIANYFRKNGFQRGDVVGIFMENKPKYVACIIGLAKIGVTSALINYQLSGEVRNEIFGKKPLYKLKFAIISATSSFHHHCQLFRHHL